MTAHIEPHLCIICSAPIPGNLTRAKAIQKGAAVEVEGKTYYRCMGRHSHDEVLTAINRTPGFTQAGKVA
jgi:hypothetical protein